MGSTCANITSIFLLLLLLNYSTIHVRASCSMVQERNSPKCNGKGTYQCDTCKCNDGYFGQFCECVSYGPSNMDLSCRAPHDTRICSGRGICQCGLCDCNKRANALEVVTGEFCECDNYSCDRHRNVVCGGHGRCECGKCICNEGWVGASCNCHEDVTKCQSANGKLCNEPHGVCQCGSCKCLDNYEGPTCEDCPTCSHKCQEYQACVQCQVFKTGVLKNQYPCYSCSFNATHLKSSLRVEKEDERFCKVVDDDECTVSFVYGFDTAGKPQVRVLLEKECPPPASAGLWRNFQNIWNMIDGLIQLILKTQPT